MESGIKEGSDRLDALDPFLNYGYRSFQADANNVFDFNAFQIGGVYRLGNATTYTNWPSTATSMAYSNVLVIRHGTLDTQTMIAFPYSNGYIYVKSGNKTNFATTSWKRLTLESF